MWTEAARLCSAHFDGSVMKHSIASKTGKVVRTLDSDALPSVFCHKEFQTHRYTVPPEPDKEVWNETYHPSSSVYKDHAYRSLLDFDESHMDSSHLDSHGEMPILPESYIVEEDQVEEEEVEEVTEGPSWINVPNPNDVMMVDLQQEGVEGHSVTELFLRGDSSHDWKKRCEEAEVKYAELSSKLDKLSTKFLATEQELKVALEEISRLQKEKEANSKVLEAARSIFREDQLKWLPKKSLRGYSWSNETIEEGLRWKLAFGTAGYELFVQKFPYPANRTLQEKLEKLKFEPGILTEVIIMMKDKVEATIPEMGRDVVLMWDEMELTPGVQFMPGWENWVGEVTLPEHDGLADHALVFFIVGMTVHFKQVVGYHFTTQATNGFVYGPIVRDLVVQIEQTGLRVRVTTMDIGSPNQKFWRWAGVDWSNKRHNTQVPCVIDSEKIPSKLPIRVAADYSHLLKNLRMAFIKSGWTGITLPDWLVEEEGLTSDHATINILKDLLDFQEEQELLMAPGLNYSTVNPTHFNKMRVYPAKAVFSGRVAASIRVMARSGHFLDTQVCDHMNDVATTTAWFLDFIRKLHTILGARDEKRSLSFFNMEKYHETRDFLKRALRIIQALDIGGRWKPVQTGYTLLLTTTLELSDEFLREGHRYFRPACLSTDPGENVFSSVRFRDPVPDCQRFVNCLKLVSTGQFLAKKRGSSYESDQCTFLTSVLDWMGAMKKSREEEEGEDIVVLQSLLDLDECAELDEFQKLVFYILAGFVLRSLKNVCTTCDKCFSDLVRDPSDQEDVPDLLAVESDFTGDALVYPSKIAYEMLVGFERLFRGMESSGEILAENLSVKQAVLRQLKPHCEKFSLKSCHGIQEKLLNRFVFIRLQIQASRKRRQYSKEQVSTEKALGSKSMYMRRAANTLTVRSSDRDNLDVVGVLQGPGPNLAEEAEAAAFGESSGFLEGANQSHPDPGNSDSDPDEAMRSFMSGSFLFKKK